MHVNICETVKLLVGFLQRDGGKLEEAEHFKCVLVVYLCSNQARELLSNNSLSLRFDLLYN